MASESSFTTTTTTTLAKEVEFEILPLFRLYKDGQVERLLGNDTVPPSLDPNTGVSSKDLLILPESSISARLYLPAKFTDGPKLPVLVYFHGGAFCIESVVSPTYHNYLNSLVAEASVICVSVEYRRAPEHPLPTAFDDSWAALQWVVSHSNAGGAEPWLTDHADFRRLFLAGDSAGANIAHHMAMRAGSSEVSILGIVLVHPFFWGSVPIGQEGVMPEMQASVDALWRYICPSSSTAGADDPLINPVAPAAPDLKGLDCRRVLVCVAGKDILRDRGWLYYERLAGSGWDGVVEIMEMDEEDHVFHLKNPSSENATIMMKRLCSFLSRDY